RSRPGPPGRARRPLRAAPRAAPRPAARPPPIPAPRPPARPRPTRSPGSREGGDAMKLLHTADWHVGKAIRGRSRATEHQQVLAEIAGVAERESVDAVIVAGDLFDTSSPTPEAERIVYRALLDLAAGGRPVLVV